MAGVGVDVKDSLNDSSATSAMSGGTGNSFVHGAKYFGTSLAVKDDAKKAASSIFNVGNILTAFVVVAGAYIIYKKVK